MRGEENGRDSNVIVLRTSKRIAENSALHLNEHDVHELLCGACGAHRVRVCLCLRCLGGVEEGA